MELTKLEKAVVVSTFVAAIGGKEIKEHIGVQTTGHIEKVFEELIYNTAPKEIQEVGVNVLNKFIHDLLKE